MNADTVGRYILNNNYGLLNKTFFNEVDQLDPGSYGIWKNGNLDIYKYFSRKEKFDFPTNGKRSKNILKKNIEQHLIGDVKVGLALSSGIDSLTLMSLINKSKLSKKLIKVFTIDFGEDFSEFQSAKKIAKKFKINIERIKFDPYDVINNFQNLISVNEAPLGGIMQMALSKLFKKANECQIKVMLSGMGSDEIFFGYESMKDFINKKDFNKIKLIDNSEISNLELLPNKLLKDIQMNENKVELYKMLYETKLPKNLQMMDRVSMQHSVELRCPFIDKDIFEHFSNYELKKMIDGRQTKIILRKLMSSIDKRINWFEQRKAFNLLKVNG